MPSHRAQQIAVHMRFGFLPVLLVRKARPARFGIDWEWGPWRRARLSEIVHVNAMLLDTWKD